MSHISAQSGPSFLQQLFRPSSSQPTGGADETCSCKAPPSTETRLSDDSRQDRVDESRSNLTGALAASKDERGKQTRFSETFGEGSYVKDPNDSKLRDLLGGVDFPGKANAKDGKMSKEDVKGLQDFLKEKGYECGPAGSDGKFGKDTLDALARFKAEGPKAAKGEAGEGAKTAANKTAAKAADEETETAAPAGKKAEKSGPKEEGLLDDVGKVADGIGSIYSNSAKRAWNGVTSIFRDDDGGKDKEAYDKAQQKAAGKALDGFSKIGDRASKTWNETGTAISNTWNEAGTAISNTWNATGEAVSGATTAAGDAVTKAGREAVKPVAYE